MTCFIEAHWSKYDKDCNPCQHELKDAVKRGSLSQEEYDKWLKGLIEFGIPKQQRMFLEDERIERQTIKNIETVLKELEQIEC